MAFKLGNLFGRLGGGSEAAGEASADAVEYQGYRIRPACRKEGGQWITAGVVTKRFGEEVKEHRFIRADKYAAKVDAEACAISKGQRIVDEQGDRMFD